MRRIARGKAGSEADGSGSEISMAPRIVLGKACLSTPGNTNRCRSRGLWPSCCHCCFGASHASCLRGPSAWCCCPHGPLGCKRKERRNPRPPTHALLELPLWLKWRCSFCLLPLLKWRFSFCFALFGFEGNRCLCWKYVLIIFPWSICKRKLEFRLLSSLFGFGPF